MTGKLKNWARWSETFITVLPERVSALASVEKTSQINIFNRGYILVGDVIWGNREVSRESAVVMPS